MQLVIHSMSELRLRAIKGDMPQALLLSGPGGVGLLSIAREIAGLQLAALLLPQNAKDQTADENGTINVEMIRQLYAQTRAKYTERQIVVIDNADKMSGGAQAAFLKLLEEPNEFIYFILTSHAPQKLLATIRSRVQQTIIHPVSREQTTSLIDRLGVTDSTKRAQLQFIADGLPAELNRLINNDEYFEHRAKIMSDARTFLQAETFEKMLIAQRYQADRPGALMMIDSAMQIIRRTMSANPQKGLVGQLEMLLDIRQNIARQFNIRLQLVRFVL